MLENFVKFVKWVIIVVLFLHKDLLWFLDVCSRKIQIHGTCPFENFGFGMCKNVQGCVYKTLNILFKYITTDMYNYLKSIMFFTTLNKSNHKITSYDNLLI